MTSELTVQTASVVILISPADIVRCSGLSNLVQLHYPRTAVGRLDLSGFGLGKAIEELPKVFRERELEIAKPASFGLTRIVGELRQLGFKMISRSTVYNILNEAGDRVFACLSITEITGPIAS